MKSVVATDRLLTHDVPPSRRHAHRAFVASHRPPAEVVPALRRPTHVVRIPAVLCCLAAMTGAARAELAPAAKVRLDAGLAQYNAGHFEAAIVELEAAYEIDPEPSLLFTWAQAERLAAHCDSAVPRYRKFIASKPSAAAIELANNGIALCEAPRRDGPRREAPASAVSDPSLPWYKNPVGGAVVAGVVGVGVGVGFLIASSASRERADQAATSDVFEDTLAVATTQRRIGITFLVVGAGLVGGGIGYHLWTTRSQARAVVGTTGTSLFVAGEF